eukprot:TRINITY_DN19598_c0_g1_i1.p3 TRINITY_DN19598_c0_g1~~TRINITY_DN19598_c0_g1_i1.p3  ORF type:complete len:105 (-),score=35.42 TRINITY_DN19598_c0_g1_i1:55-369(-)
MQRCSRQSFTGSVRADNVLRVVTLLVCQAAFAEAAKGEAKGFFDVDWSNPTAAASDLAWKCTKVCFALSPLIAIVALFCCTKDDPEEEELRRKKKFDFSLAGEE